MTRDDARVAEKVTIPYPRRWAALGVLVGSMLLLAIDGTVLYLAVPSLTADLAPSSTQVLWIGDVYALSLIHPRRWRRSRPARRR